MKIDAKTKRRFEAEDERYDSRNIGSNSPERVGVIPQIFFAVGRDRCHQAPVARTGSRSRDCRLRLRHGSELHNFYNDNTMAAKDVQITCSSKGFSDTAIDFKTRTVYDVIGQKSFLQVHDLQMGLVRD